jgi:hypothetical protein
MFANRDTGVPVRRASAAASGSGSVGLQDEDSEQEELPQSKGKRRNRKVRRRSSGVCRSVHAYTARALARDLRP